MTSADELPSHHRIATAAIRVFADDGRLDLAELDWLIAIAMRDGKVDDDERRVLAGIFDRVSQDEVPHAVWMRIAEARSVFGI